MLIVWNAENKKGGNMRLPLMNNFSSVCLNRALSFPQNGSAYLTFDLFSRYFPVVLINRRFSSVVIAIDWNVCVLPNFICWSATFQGDGAGGGAFGRWLGYEGGAFMDEISALEKEIPESSLCSFYHVNTVRR